MKDHTITDSQIIGNPGGVDIIGQGHKHKMPTGLKVFLIILISLLVLIAAVIGAVFGCFYVPNTDRVSTADPEVDAQTFAMDIVGGAIEDLGKTQTYGHANFDLTEEDFDQIIYYALGNKKFVEWLDTKVYIDIDKKNYNFTVEAKAFNFFQTIGIIKTELESVENIPGYDEEGIVFTFTDLQVGRLTGLLDVASRFIPKDLENTVNEAFKNAGFNMKMEIDQKRIVYPYSQLRIDLLTKLDEIELENMELYLQMIRMLVNRDDTWEIKTENQLTIDLNMSLLAGGSYAPLDPKENKSREVKDADTKIGYVETIADEYFGKIQDAEIDALIHYMFTGYQSLSDDEKAIVFLYRYDLAELGLISDSEELESYTEKYGSQFVANEMDLNSFFIENFVKELRKGNNEITLSIPDYHYDEKQKKEERFDLSSLFCNKELIGLGYNLKTKYHVVNSTNEKAGWHYRINYAFVEDIQTHCVVDDEGNENLQIVFCVNINGFHAKIALMTQKVDSNEPNKVAFSFSKKAYPKAGLYFGELECDEEMSDSLINTLLDQLCKAAEIGGEWFTIDKDKLMLEVNFSDYIDKINTEASFTFYGQTVSPEATATIDIYNNALNVNITLGAVTSTSNKEGKDGIIYNVSDDIELINPSITNPNMKVFLIPVEEKVKNIKVYFRKGTFEGSFKEVEGKYLYQPEPYPIDIYTIFPGAAISLSYEEDITGTGKIAWNEIKNMTYDATTGCLTIPVNQSEESEDTALFLGAAFTAEAENAFIEIEKTK